MNAPRARAGQLAIGHAACLSGDGGQGPRQPQRQQRRQQQAQQGGPAVTAKTSSAWGNRRAGQPAGNQVTTNQFRAPVRATAASKLRPQNASARQRPAGGSLAKQGFAAHVTTPTRGCLRCRPAFRPCCPEARPPPRPLPWMFAMTAGCAEAALLQSTPLTPRAPTATVTGSLMLEMYFSLQTGVTLSRMLVTCGTRSSRCPAIPVGAAHR